MQATGRTCEDRMENAVRAARTTQAAAALGRDAKVRSANLLSRTVGGFSIPRRDPATSGGPMAGYFAPMDPNDLERALRYGFGRLAVRLAAG